MGGSLHEMFTNLSSDIIKYIPNLVGGIILLIIGWILGWFAKRVVIQLAVILRLERFLVSFRWGKDFAKADLRYGLYNYLGNIAFFIIFIIFFNDALSTWKLTIFSTLLEKTILYIPKFLISAVIFSAGWLIASATSKSIYKALRRESVPRAALIAKFSKTAIILFFAAMALVELDIAREVVIIGFSTIFITLGAFTIVLAAVGGREFVKKIKETLSEE